MLTILDRISLNSAGIVLAVWERQNLTRTPCIGQNERRQGTVHIDHAEWIHYLRKYAEKPCDKAEDAL